MGSFASWKLRNARRSAKCRVLKLVEILLNDDERMQQLTEMCFTALECIEDPICGNCGKHKSEHHFENEIFCFTDTTGDIFTDEPHDYRLIDFIEHFYPEQHAQYIKEWKRMHGHLGEEDASDT